MFYNVHDRRKCQHFQNRIMWPVVLPETPLMGLLSDWKLVFHRTIMWSSVVKIQYTELKLSCGNDPVVKNYIYSNGNLDLWPNDPKINRVLPLPQENHVAKFGKDPMTECTELKLLCGNLCGRPAARHPPAIHNHIIRPVSRRRIKMKW